MYTSFKSLPDVDRHVVSSPIRNKTITRSLRKSNGLMPMWRSLSLSAYVLPCLWPYLPLVNLFALAFIFGKFRILYWKSC